MSGGKFWPLKAFHGPPEPLIPWPYLLPIKHGATFSQLKMQAKVSIKIPFLQNVNIRRGLSPYFVPQLLTANNRKIMQLAEKEGRSLPNPQTGVK